MKISMPRRRALPLAAALLMLAGAAGAQQGGGFAPNRLPADTLPARDLSAFREPGSSWRVVGGVGGELVRAQLSTEPGQGIIANVATAGRGENLATSWEHG